MAYALAWCGRGAQGSVRRGVQRELATRDSSDRFFEYRHRQARDAHQFIGLVGDANFPKLRGASQMQRSRDTRHPSPSHRAPHARDWR